MIATVVGFDSAWTDNAKAPGAICAVQISPERPAVFHPPRLVRFADAVSFVGVASAGSDYTLVALDQPTIVTNPSGMRPAERVVASVISWVGGGVQPANRGRTGMFCDASPIWRFLDDLAAMDDPMAARTATSGRWVMEVFPALALASFNAGFYRRLGAPRYNPANARRFRLADWRRVCATASTCFERSGLAEPASWCVAAAGLSAPRKADQDQLDAMLSLLVALAWRLGPAAGSVMIGDLRSGYIVTPASDGARARLTAAGRKLGVPIDGAI